MGPRSGRSWFRLRRSPTGATPHNNLGASARAECSAALGAEPALLRGAASARPGAGRGGAVTRAPRGSGRAGRTGVQGARADLGPGARREARVLVPRLSRAPPSLKHDSSVAFSPTSPSRPVTLGTFPPVAQVRRLGTGRCSLLGSGNFNIIPGLCVTSERLQVQDHPARWWWRGNTRTLA